MRPPLPLCLRAGAYQDLRIQAPSLPRVSSHTQLSAPLGGPIFGGQSLMRLCRPALVGRRAQIAAAELSGRRRSLGAASCVRPAERRTARELMSG